VGTFPWFHFSQCISHPKNKLEKQAQKEQNRAKQSWAKLFFRPYSLFVLWHAIHISLSQRKCFICPTEGRRGVCGRIRRRWIPRIHGEGLSGATSWHNAATRWVGKRQRKLLSSLGQAPSFGPALAPAPFPHPTTFIVRVALNAPSFCALYVFCISVSWYFCFFFLFCLVGRLARLFAFVW